MSHHFVSPSSPFQIHIISPFSYSPNKCQRWDANRKRRVKVVQIIFESYEKRGMIFPGKVRQKKCELDPGLTEGKDWCHRRLIIHQIYLNWYVVKLFANFRSKCTIAYSMHFLWEGIWAGRRNGHLAFVQRVQSSSLYKLIIDISRSISTDPDVSFLKKQLCMAVNDFLGL